MLLRMKIPNGRSLAGTRRFVALVVRPRPDTRTIRMHTIRSHQQNTKQLPSRKKSNIRRSQQSLWRSRLCARRSPLFKTFSSPFVDIPFRDLPLNATSPCSGLESGCLEDHGINPESESTTTDSTATRLSDFVPSHGICLGQPRILRSSKSRKCKSIHDTHNKLLKLKDPIPVSNTWPHVKRPSVGNSSSSNTSLSIISSRDSLDQRIRNIHDGSSTLPYRPVPESATSTSIVWYDCSEQTRRTTGDSEYLTAPSHFDEDRSADRSTLADMSVLARFDNYTEALSERIYQARPTETHTKAPSCLVPQLSVHPIPVVPSLLDSPDGPQIGLLGARPNDPRTIHPILTLTMPTPAPPQSPLFVPQSPITVSKFLAAATSPNEFTPQSCTSHFPCTNVSYRTPPASTLPSCDNCNSTLPSFDQRTSCYACDDRWLACKVWYRATDGGRRRWLTEPYIRPGECNETNRAILRELESELGFGLGLGSALVDLEDRCYDTPIKGRLAEGFWRTCAQRLKLEKAKFRSLRRCLISKTLRTLRHRLSYLKSSLATLA